MPIGVYQHKRGVYHHSAKTKRKIGGANKRNYLLGKHNPSRYWLGKERPDMVDNKFAQGIPSWNKGIFGKRKNWKQAKEWYHNLHNWIRNTKGKASKCEFCGKEGTGRGMHWANVDHKYSRVLEDYISLCQSCHRKYDIKNNFVKCQAQKHY